MRNERDPWFPTCLEGDGHSIHFMPVRRRLSILRGNVLPNDQAVALADLLAEPCGSGGRGAHRRGFLQLKEYRPQRLRARPFFTVRNALTDKESIPGVGVGWPTLA